MYNTLNAQMYIVGTYLRERCLKLKSYAWRFETFEFVKRDREA